MKNSKLRSKFLSLLLALCMVVGLLPVTALPALATSSTGDFTVTGGVLDTDYSYSNNTLTILKDTELTISGTTTVDKILVPTGVTANIILDGVNIEATSDSDVNAGYAFAIESGGIVTLTLKEGSVNTLQSHTGYAGLQVPSGASVTIGGTGSLSATGGTYGAGIGGGSDVDNGEAAGTITINSGTITATGGPMLVGAAGIGGGSGNLGGGNGGIVTINGGTVTATGGTGSADSAPGIGGGKGGTIGGSEDGTHGTVNIANTMEYATGQYGLGTDYTKGTGSAVSDFPTDSHVKVREITYWTDYATTPEGEGTQGSPYLIEDGADLAWVAQQVNSGDEFNDKTIKLANTIDLSAHHWVPIGELYDSFYGIFDGGGHEISGLTINTPEANYVGLFGFVGNGGRVEKVSVSGSVTGKDNVGGVVAYSDGEVVGVISNVTVNGSTEVGGVVGDNNGMVINSYNTGTVTASGINVGGVVGYNNIAKSVANCYNTGDVTGIKGVGGVAGFSEGKVINSYNIAKVNGDSEVGGVVGSNYGSVENSYWLASDALLGVGKSSNSTETNVKSFADASSKITWDDNTEHANLLEALNAGAAAYNEDDNSWIAAKEWRVGQNGGYPVFATTWGDYVEVVAEVDGVYTITRPGQLAWVAEMVSGGWNSFIGKTIKLENPIDLGKHLWLPIGNSSGNFYGTFDGGGHEISGLTIDTPEADNVGLFGYVSNSGTVKNVGVSGTVSGKDNVGGVVGTNEGVIINSHSNVTVTGVSQVGGVAGSNDGTVANSYNTGNVGGNSTIGGISGAVSATISGTVTNCYNVGAVSGKGSSTSIGSLIGNLGVGATINNSYHLADSSIASVGLTYGTTTNVETFDSDQVINAGTYSDKTLTTALSAGAAIYNNTNPEASAYVWLDGTGGGYPNLGSEGIYAVTSEFESVGGTVTTDADGQATGGATVTITATANSGYTVDDISVTGVDGTTDITVTDTGADNKYTFIMPTQAVTVAVNFAPVLENVAYIDADGTAQTASDVTQITKDTTQLKAGWYVVNSAVSLSETLGINGEVHLILADGGSLSVSTENSSAILGGESDSLTIYGQSGGTGSLSATASGANSNGIFGGFVTINGGTVSARGIEYGIRAGKLTVNGGTVSAISEASGKGITADKITFAVGMQYATSMSLIEEDANFSVGDVSSSDMMSNVKVREITSSWVDHANAGDIDWTAQNITIETAAQLAHLAKLVNDNTDDFKGQTITLASPIDLGAHQWAPIGTNKAYAIRFRGTFDGAGHAITGLYVNTPEANNVGLFGYIQDSTVKNVSVSGSVTGATNVGGVVGTSHSGTITDSHSSVTVTGANQVGGVVGNNIGTVANSYNTGTVTGTGSAVGGVAGLNDKGAVVNSYNAGDIRGDHSVGGVVGYNHGGDATGTVANSYSTGTVTGNDYVGGVVGSIYARDNGTATVKNSYYLAKDGARGVGNIDGSGTNTITNVGSFSGASSAITWDTSTHDGSTSYENLLTALNAGAKAYNATVTENYAAEWLADNATTPTNSGYPVLGSVHWGMVANAGDATWNEDTIVIDTAEELAHLAYLFNNDSSFEGKTITLGANLDIGAHEWIPIGKAGSTFTDTFDGKGHTITGLRVNMPDTNNVGLFGVVGTSGTVQNLGVSGSVTGRDNVGSVVGSNSGKITNCYGAGTVTGNEFIGGVAGNNNGTVTNSYSTCTVNSVNHGGGVVGHNNEVVGVSSTIENSYYLAQSGITGVGRKYDNATIINVGSFAAAENSAIDWDLGTHDGSTYYISLQDALNFGALAYNRTDPAPTILAKGWEVQTDTNGGYPMYSDKAIRAADPTITTPLEAAVYTPDDMDATALDATATVTDGGQLSYQWYRNTENSSANGTEIVGETAASFTPPIDELGTIYYYCIVKNTISEALLDTTSQVTSNVAEITVAEVGVTLDITSVTAGGLAIYAATPSDITAFAVSADSTDVTDTVTWSLSTTADGTGEMPANSGVSLKADDNSIIKTSKTAPVGTYYMVATSTDANAFGDGEATASAEFTVSREASEAYSIVVVHDEYITDGLTVEKKADLDGMGSEVSVNIPTLAEGELEKHVTAYVFDQYDEVMPNETVTWDGNYTELDIDGYTFTVDPNNPNKATAVFTAAGAAAVANSAKALYINARAGWSSGSNTFSIAKREDANVSSMKLFVDQEEIGAEDTVVKPASSGADNTTRTYTVKGYDQYGLLMETAPSATWELNPYEGEADSAVSLEKTTASDSNTVSVNHAAVTNKVHTLTATSGAVEVSTNITVVDIDITWPTVTLVDNSPTYGDNWTELLSISNDGRAELDGALQEGTFSIVSAVPDAGTQSYSLNWVSNAKQADNTTPLYNVTESFDQIPNGTGIEIGQKALSVTGLTATDRAYDGTTAVTLTGGEITADQFVNGDTMASLTGFTMPTSGTVSNPNASENTKAVNFASGSFDTTSTNYTITVPMNVTVNITKADITGIVSGEIPTPATILANDTSNNASAASLKTYAGLPSDVDVNYGDSKTVNLGITWTDTADYDRKGGIYTYTGTLTVGDNFNTYSGDIEVTVTVTPVTATLSLSTTTLTKAMSVVDAATDYAALGLPTAITVDYDNNVADTTYSITEWNKTMAQLKAIDATSADVVETLTPTFTAPDWATLSSTPTFELTITAKYPVTVTATAPDDVTYGTALGDPSAMQTALDDGTDSDADTNNSYTYEYKLSTADDSTYTETAPTDAGAYTMRATLNSDSHSGSDTDTFTINKKTLTSSMIADIAAVTYNGNAHEPTPTVTDGDLLDRADYTVSYENNTDAGTAKVILTASATGNYIDADPKANKEFTIEKASIAGLVPTISGTAEVGQVLSADLPTVSSSELTWKWFRGDDEIGGATEATYTLTVADSNKAISVQAFAIPDGNYTGNSPKSIDDVTVAKMAISGVVNITDSTGDTIIVGDTLTASDSAILPTEAKGGSFAWYRNDTIGEPIATTAAYDVIDGDATLIVVYTPTANFDGTVQATVEVGKTQLTAVPTITGNTTLNSELTATVAGLTITTDYTLQWLRDGAPIDGQTAVSYTIAKADLGKTITVKAIGTGTYTGETVSTDSKIIAATVPEAPSVTATAGDGQVTLSWTAFDGGRPITGYTVQMGSEAPIELTPNITSYVFENLENGTAYDFTVSATNGEGTSANGTASATPAVPPTGSGGGGVATPDNTVDSEEPLTSDDFKELAESGDSLTVNGDDEIEAEFDTNALEAILGEAEGKTVEFIAKEADASDVNDAQKIVIGDNLVLDLRVLVDGVEFTDFATGEVTISLPYTLADGETAANLKVYYVDDEGNKTLIESSFVDGILTFKTNHFSLYMVTYEAMSFVDVMADDWYYDAVLYAVENGLFNGVSETEFAPNVAMNRAMMWTVLARMSDVDTDGGAEWYTKGMEWAMENEVSDGTDPMGNLTREQLVTMLYRYAGSPVVDGMLSYPDDDMVSEWAYEAFIWAVDAGVITGMDDGTLAPQGEATRAQVATMLMRYLTAE